MSFNLNPNRRKQKIGYESLEDRNLLAGDVLVFESGGHLYLRGDRADNQVQVVVDGNQLKVEGVNGTTINHQESYRVKEVTVTDDSVSFEGGFRGNMGFGHDTLEIKDAHFGARSVIFGGAGDDVIDLVDSEFIEHITIQTFDGNDSVSTKGSEFKDDFYVFTLDGQDSVTSIDTVFDGYSIVFTGEHADKVHSQDSHYMGEVNLILSHNGNDEVQLNDPVVGEDELGVYLGNDHDTVGADLDEATVGGNIKISGQAGVDQPGMMTMGDDVADKMTVLGFEKGELVFESALGGPENVTEGFSTFTADFSADDFDSDFTYIEQYATPVVLDSTETIKQIDWSGTYTRDYFLKGLPDLGDSFFIQIFEGTDDGVPDVDSAVTFEIEEANRIVVGEAEIVYYGSTPVYGYHAEIEYTMEAGKQYWVSIFTKLVEDEWVEQNYWEWGAGETSQWESTIFNQGYDPHENDWRFNEDPYKAPGIMDLRLRV